MLFFGTGMTFLQQKKTFFWQYLGESNIYLVGLTPYPPPTPSSPQHVALYATGL